ncbi:hypothetical protein F5879DRAFT_357294 [Lentinula edodes]|nr:hypothetical protein F5879DRAFT_357294 [Lentinula edodes]
MLFFLGPLPPLLDRLLFLECGLKGNSLTIDSEALLCRLSHRIRRSQWRTKTVSVFGTVHVWHVLVSKDYDIYSDWINVVCINLSIIYVVSYIPVTNTMEGGVLRKHPYVHAFPFPRVENFLSFPRGEGQEARRYVFQYQRLEGDNPDIVKSHKPSKKETDL